MGLATMENYQSTIGRFTERSVGKTHEYSPNTDIESGWDPKWDQFAQDFPHKLWTLDGYRYARVLKTVAYIVRRRGRVSVSLSLRSGTLPVTKYGANYNDA